MAYFDVSWEEIHIKRATIIADTKEEAQELYKHLQAGLCWELPEEEQDDFTEWLEENTRMPFPEELDVQARSFDGDVREVPYSY